MLLFFYAKYHIIVLKKRWEKMGKIYIKDKYTNKALIAIETSTDKRPDKYVGICLAMLALLYAMNRKGKAQYWVVPQEIACRLQLALNWGDGDVFKEHKTLYGIPVHWVKEGE